MRSVDIPSQGFGSARSGSTCKCGVSIDTVVLFNSMSGVRYASPLSTAEVVQKVFNHNNFPFPMSNMTVITTDSS